MPDGRVCPDHFRGWLWKWTNYIKGYQKRWFVLSNGLLSYYRNQAEMAHHCRGTINLSGAFIDTEDSCSFTISNGGTQVFHLRAGSEVERQRWVTALELAKAKAIKMLESDEEEEFSGEESGTKTLSQKIEDLQTCNELVTKHGSSLQRAIGDLQELESQDNLLQKLKIANEKATLFRITSNAMISACAEFLELAQSQEKKWQRALQNERNQRLRLEETVECLAKQHNTLERQCQKKTGTSPSGVEQVLEDTKADSDEDDDHEFFDAISEHPEILNAFKDDSSSEISEDSKSISSEQSINPMDGSFGKLPSDTTSQQSTDTTSSKETSVPTASTESLGSISSGADIISKAVRKYRDSIPEKPDISVNLWSILKNCIGRELSRIPMPVNFNEPLSMLQRLVEELEYSYILDRAAECENSLEQMCHVAAFTVSSYSTTCNRTTKPFNPLLGETYECDRTDTMGWWSLCEQVSHHPPASAMHAEHKDWIFWQEFTATSKFRGKYLSIIPQGVAHLKFNKTGNHYTWRRVATTVHNIIVGRLWIDNSGTMEIVNDVTGDKCHLEFAAYNYFSRETPRKVTGYAADSQNVARYYLSGTWDNKMEAGKIVYNKNPKGQAKAQTLPPVPLWKRVVPPVWTEKMYNFTEFALTLNQPEEGLAPTDSRLRPDQRLMEEGKWDEANQEKLRIEDKQRAVRRKREADAAEAAEEGKVYESYKPVWFEKVVDDFTDVAMHVFKGGYWEAKEKQAWHQSLDLF